MFIRKKKNFVKGIASRVKLARLSTQLTIEEMAAQLEIENEDYKKLEAGRADFSVSYLFLIAMKLDVSPKSLIPPSGDTNDSDLHLDLMDEDRSAEELSRLGEIASALADIKHDA